MNVLSENSLILYGTVGEGLFGDGFTARDVVNALATLRGKPVSVRINSGGGIADEGVAIYNSLKAHNGEVTVYVDGIAASAASIIAMAGERVVMRTGSVMMIHDPMALAAGNAAGMEKAKQALDAIADSMADIYAEKTGRAAADIRNEMREETWLTAADAKAKGFADEEESDDAVEVSAFDYRAYMRAPDAVLALSDTRAWSHTLQRGRASTPTPPTAPAIQKPVDPGEQEKARCAAIAEMCGDMGNLCIKLIREHVPVEAARVLINTEKDRVTGIRNSIKIARKLYPQMDEKLADQYIAAGASVAAFGNEILEKIAAAQEQFEVRSHFSPYDDDKPARDGKSEASAIYAQRRQTRERKSQ